MEWRSHTLDFRDTGYFSQLILNYLDRHPDLRPFFSHTPDVEGVRNAILVRQQTTFDRQQLVAQLQQQYKDIAPAAEVVAAINLLGKQNTFTITTAHQPNLLTGPLYFVYKLLHTIRIVEQLSKAIPEHHFVPVYFMGSEDADFNELSHFTINGKKYQWSTRQTGAFGRMIIDNDLLKILNEAEKQLSMLPFAEQMMNALRVCYAQGKTIAQATFEWVHHLMGQYGLVVLIPDHAAFKSSFREEMKADLCEHTAYEVLQKTKAYFPNTADWQANARPINLFYLKDNIRERIEREGNDFKVVNTSLRFSQEEILNLLHQHPESFSPNVILRPLFQEKILPNLAYIGGAGEIAYWLQLQPLFQQYQIPFPVLWLRHSVMMLTNRQDEKLCQLGFSSSEIFRPTAECIKTYTKRHSGHQLSLTDEKAELKKLFEKIADIAGQTDVTLQTHSNALHHSILKKVEALENKMLRAEKRKFKDATAQIERLKTQLFPGGNLQERSENMLSYYAAYGAQWLEQIYRHFPENDTRMIVLTQPTSN
ncbi:MAG: bacillithiol biosynthesis cysteine-adding enzyme BshC [Bacteroidetes bacterium]|nr:bacillithiol biosynthesis cysteine-adding enzyme BshC [Bacteroidota bacterium]